MAAVKEMTEGKIFPQLFYFTLPLLMGNLLQQTYSLVDAAIVGKFLGIDSLAAVGAVVVSVFLWLRSSVHTIIRPCVVVCRSVCNWPP